ncbi:MAG TPA: hypothetical protein ENJ56_03270, partial [Anaerolineae bacterium]|nr:hypothetical protein [Anaerolineae bacterium]
MATIMREEESRKATFPFPLFPSHFSLFTSSLFPPMNKSQQAVEAILSALRPSQTPDNWLAWIEAQALDWNDIAIRAIVFGLAPQLYRRVADWQISIPPVAMAKLKVTHAAQAKRAANIYQQLDRVLAACPEYGLQPIGLKGIHLAAKIYAEPALRPMNDIDLLFEPSRLPIAEKMLQELGYGGKYKSAETGAGVTKHTSTFKQAGAKDNTPNPYLSSKNERRIEPHGLLEESWYGLKVNLTPGVRARAQQVVLANEPILVMAREDLLLHICIHFCFHLIEGAPSLVQFGDILAVTQAGGFDWQVVTDRAIDRRAAPFVLAALTLAQKILDAPISQTALTQLQAATPAKLRQHIDTL